MAVVEAATGIVRYANPAFCHLISKKGEELTGRPFAEMVPEGKACLAMLNRVYRTGEAETYTKPDLEKSDQNTWSYVMWPVLGGDQHPLGIMIQISETTLLQRQTAAMNESLLIAGIRQHELTEAAEKQNAQLQEEINERRRAEEALRLLTKTLEQQVAERTALAEGRAIQLQSLAVELIVAEERERDRISTLLHEDLQQILAVARFQVQAVYDSMPKLTELSEVERMLSISIGKTRRLSHDLSPTILHHSSLTAALRWLSRQMHERFGLEVQVEEENVPDLENTPLKILIFRATQELLFNISKHAGVQHALVHLSGSDGRLSVTVSDQGKGFEPAILESSSEVKTGLGLLSLRERVKYIGGSFSIESAPGQGSRITFAIPSVLAGKVPQQCDPMVQSRGIQSENALYGNEPGLRVLLVDDHKLVRQGLIQLISGQPDIQVIGEAASGPEAIELVKELEPNVVIMDVSMPGMDGIEATRRIKAMMPAVRVIGLTMIEEENIAHGMRHVGAELVVTKTASSSVLLKAIYGSK